MHGSKVPFWQFFRNRRIGWIGHSLLVQSSKTDYRIFFFSVICILILIYFFEYDTIVSTQQRLLSWSFRFRSKHCEWCQPFQHYIILAKSTFFSVLISLFRQLTSMNLLFSHHYRFIFNKCLLELVRIIFRMLQKFYLWHLQILEKY